ncbi:Chromosome segregation atpase [Apiospora rasikravindrae]|uniref:Chromosome segregation atpase n=1 Tax=Apiospora rasikravindrae TaxID=990691 RepID=A0ABR1SXM4_9PEZI
MPPVERDAPADRVDRPQHLRHQSSASSDQMRGALIPMWDSSDPERAPPPLPLNPQSPTVGTSRIGTSAAIQSAHAALNEKARENALVPTSQKRVTLSDMSPEKSLVPRGSPHKRMQSLQAPTVRDLSLMIEGSARRDSVSSVPQRTHSPEKNSRPGTPVRGRESERGGSVDREQRDGTPTPMPITLTPVMRQQMRRAPHSILSENTPPQSATMLALQNMPTASLKDTQPRELPREPQREPWRESHREKEVPMPEPLAPITNHSAPMGKTAPSMDNLSHQIVALTAIATNLQKEMATLSRRSRDNATDLMSLKEATHARDEDIRKSLREIVNAKKAEARHARDAYGDSLYVEHRPHGSPPPSKNGGFSLPRIPSPNSFAASMDGSTLSMNSSAPSLVGDSPATLALLEKIIREMGTKDGQDGIIGRLTELVEMLPGMASSAKVEELIQQLKSTSQELSLVPAGGQGGGGGGNMGRPRNFSFDEDDDGSLRELDWSQQHGSMTQRPNALLHDREHQSPAAARGHEVLNEEVIKVIRGVKDSVAAGGGLTAEVKALVRELRGEVLGMGRDIGRRLDEVSTKTAGKEEPATKMQMERIVDEGIEQMKLHVNELLKEHRRVSSASMKSIVDYQEIYNALNAALHDQEANKAQPDLCRDDVIHAIKEAWEDYKPEISVEQIGLDRDEILVCLKEGLEDFAPQREGPDSATREDVYEAVAEGLKNYSPPKVETPAGLSRDEILEAVRECLEEFEFPVAPSAMNELTRDDMLDAVKQGLNSFEFPNNANALVPHGGEVDNNEVIERLHDIMQFMREEFKAASEQNAAANGRDTEQVIDATKDGIEQLRIHMEDYIDRASSGNGQAANMDSLLHSLDGFRGEVAELIARSEEGSKSVLTEEIGSLRDAVNSVLVPHTPPTADNREILEAMRDGLERVRQELLRPHAGTTEVLDAMHEGFGDLRASVERMSNKPVDLTANDEILDALKSGLDGVKQDIILLREEQQSPNDRAIATVGDTTSNAMVPVSADALKQDDIKNLEVMLAQLRTKMEALEPAAPTESLSKQDLAEMENMIRNVQESVVGITEKQAPESLSKDDLARMEEMLRNVQESVAGMEYLRKKDPENPDDPGIPVNLEDAANKEDVLAIETILRNTKDRIEDLVDGEQAVRKDHIDNIETLVLETKESVVSITGQLELMSKKEDIAAVELLVTQLTTGLDEMKERAEKSLEDPEKVTKTDVNAIEAVCYDVKTIIEQMVKSDIAALPTKEELKPLQDVTNEVKTVLDTQVEANAKAFEERQAEIVGVGERVTEVKTFLEEFQGLLKGKLEDESNGLEALQKLLAGLSETIESSTVAADLKEVHELMKAEFEESKNGVVGAKLDSDEKLQATSDTLSTKIDEKVGELITKYEEFQLVMDDRAKAGEARDVELEAAVVGTKAIADELKLLIDTLGSTVTDSMEKMEEASKTVFGRVDDLFSKSEENHSDDKNEHSMTRDQVQAAVTAVEGLQGQVVEYQPKILESIKNVLLVVGQHYEHSQLTSTDLQKQIEDVKDKENQLLLLPPPEKYDDTEMHSKLDKLIDHSHTADKAYSQLDTLEKVHAQVVQTACDISSFLEAQTKRIEADHEDHEKHLQDAEKKVQETNISLAVAQAEKEHVEANVSSLRSEEEQLRESIMSLRTEQEYLQRQKTRLTADVSSLETAMHIRREELQAMESRAEGLERRILEGVLDHSRALLLTKAGTKGRDAMSRKRVPGARSGLAPVDPASLNAQPPSAHRKAVNIAVNGNRGLVPPNPAGAARRILSLSQINNNMASGGIKRSQSVRTGNGSLRKSSWGGGLGKKYGDLEGDKENEVIDSVREIDEPSDDNEAEPEAEPEATPEAEPESTVDDDASEDTAEPNDDLEASGAEDNASDAGTLRRSSLGTTVITSTETEGGYTEDGYTDDDYDSRSEWTNSAVGTESGLGTESIADTDSMVDSSVVADDSNAMVVHAA